MEYNILIVTRLLSKSNDIILNDLCRKNRIKFIYSSSNGLFSFIFNDFGKEHIIYEEHDCELSKYYIKNLFI